MLVIMNIIIVVYDGIDIWDLAFAYKAFSSLEDINLRLVTNNQSGQILCKDKNLVLGGFELLNDLEEADILWICEGESAIETLQKDAAFIKKLQHLASVAKKTVCIGASSCFFVDGFIDRGKSVSTNPVFAKMIKKSNLNYVPDLMLNNDRLISGSARIGGVLALREIFKEFFPEREFEKIHPIYRYDKFSLKMDERECRLRQKNLKKLYKQALKMEPNRNLLQVKVDALRDSFGFYIQKDFDFLSFAILYSLLSNRENTNYVIGDKKGKFYVRGGHFFVMSTHSLHQIERIGTLILTGGPVIDTRLNDSFLKYWIYKTSPKCKLVICLDGSDKLLGVSGVLVDYDPMIEREEGQKPKRDGKFVFLQNSYELIDYLSTELKVLVGEKQEKLLRSDYFF